MLSNILEIALQMGVAYVYNLRKWIFALCVPLKLLEYKSLAIDGRWTDIVYGVHPC